MRSISIVDVSGFIQAVEAAQTPGAVVLWEPATGARLQIQFEYVDEANVRCRLVSLGSGHWLTLRAQSPSSASSSIWGGYSLTLRVPYDLGVLREGWALSLEVGN